MLTFDSACISAMQVWLMWLSSFRETINSYWIDTFVNKGIIPSVSALNNPLDELSLGRDFTSTIKGMLAFDASNMDGC